MINAIHGQRAEPLARPPFPAVAGLQACPTVINNVESLTNLPDIVRNGAEWFRSVGTPGVPGTKLVSLAGAVRQPGLCEVPLGHGPRRDDEYPIVLNTGRVLYHWHGGTMTTRVDGLVELVPEVEASISPIDADTYGVVAGQQVRVTSRRGSIVCRARVTDEVYRGELFMPFVSLQGAAANFLTNDVYDPNGMPEYKACAVRIAPV